MSTHPRRSIAHSYCTHSHLLDCRMPGAGGPNAAVEVEMRLGLIYTMDLNGGFQSRAFKSRPGSAPVVITPAYRSANNTRFMSGVCERDFRGYFAGAEKLAPLQAGQHHHRAVTTAYNYGNGRRMNQDSAGTLSMESKEKVLVGASRTHTLDIAHPHPQKDEGLCHVFGQFSLHIRLRSVRGGRRVRRPKSGAS